MNPLTGNPFTDKYRDINSKVVQLPANTPDLKNKFYDLLDKHQLIILSGETGSGKSTQIGKQLLEYFKYDKKVVMTQPRTLNAQSIASRVADELDVFVGDEVGYHYKFNKRVSDKTKLSYVTDGLLFNQVLRESKFGDYTGIIIDEAHERNVYIDFLLLYIKREILSKKNPEMRYVIMSATLDLEKFRDYFKGISVGVHQIPGRTFPVERIYLTKQISDDYQQVIMEHIKMIITAPKSKYPDGDIVIFLKARSEIDQMKQQIMKENLNKVVVYGLYRGVPETEKHLATDADAYKKTKGNPTRKIVLATNIAETGVTIDGVVYVIDPGYAFEMSYDSVKRMNILRVEHITKASAKQRAGRAGRTRPGFCFHLYTQKQYDNFKESKEPDIRISNIDNILLNLSEQIDNLDKFISELIEPPSKQQMEASIKYLTDMNLMEDNKLTEAGKCVQTTGLDIPLGLTFLAASKYGVSSEVNKILGMIQSLDKPMKWFIAPARTEQTKMKMYRKIVNKYRNMRGDIFSFYQMYQDYLDSGRKYDWLKKKFISIDAMITAEKVMNQLNEKTKEITEECKPKQTAEIEDTLMNRILYSFIHGYYYNIAIIENNMYKIVSNKELVSVKEGENNLLDKITKVILFGEYALIDDDPTLSMLINIYDPKVIEKIQPKFYSKVFLTGGKKIKKSSPKPKKNTPTKNKKSPKKNKKSPKKNTPKKNIPKKNKKSPKKSSPKPIKIKKSPRKFLIK